MSDRLVENQNLEVAIRNWDNQFGATAEVSSGQDMTGYDFVEIRVGGGRALVEQEAGGWCLYDLGGIEPTALTDCVKNPIDLTTAIGKFVRSCN